MEFTLENQVSIPAPTGPQSAFLNIDVTNLVEDMLANPPNLGFIWMLQDETEYRSVNLGTSENRYLDRRPVLTINYSIPQSITYYIRDAAGNVVATYKKNVE